MSHQAEFNSRALFPIYSKLLGKGSAEMEFRQNHARIMVIASLKHTSL